MDREDRESMKTFGRFRLDWVEPAHPSIVKLHDDLLAIYRVLRDKLQPAIDQAFDRVSRQIGFVVTTTIPVVMEFSEQGLKDIRIGADHLRGTLFEKEIMAALKEFRGAGDLRVAAGVYKLYVIWYEALKLKLRTDWMEPAHFRLADIRRRVETIGPSAAQAVNPEVMEPAHWFDPGIAIALEEKVLIAVLDEVYPELRLMDRIAITRESLRERIRPEVMEPAHFRRRRPESLEEILQRLRRERDWL